MLRSALLGLVTLNLVAHAGPVVPPPNDACEGAQPVALGDLVLGTTQGATPDHAWPRVCGTPLEGSAVWFVFTNGPDAQRVAASLCSPANDGAFKSSSVFVYEDLCADAGCAPCQYVAPIAVGTDPGELPCTNTAQAGAAWCARAGGRYLIGVVTDTPGIFEIELLALAPCTTAEAIDSDQDTVPDADDIAPAIYDPCQIPEASFPVITIEQLSLFYGSTSTQPLSDHGRFSVTIPNRGDDFTYLSLEIEGLPAITNMPLWTTDFPSATPFETRATLVPLPTQPGVALTDVEIRYCITDVPVPGVPSIAPVQTVPVVQSERRFGGAVPAGQTVVGVAPAALGHQVFQDGRTSEVVFNIDEDDDTVTAQELLDWSKRPGFDIIDLDEANERLACGPNACANSLKWLNEKYCLEVDDITNATDDELLDDLRARMGSDTSTGETCYGDGTRLPRSEKGFLNGKENFITDNEMPLRIGGQGATSPNPGQGVEVDNFVTNTGLLPSFRRGADIEVFTKWGGTSGTDNGHWLNLVSIVGLMNEDGELCYHAIVADDRRQGQPDTNPADEDTVKLEMQGNTWTFSRGSGPHNVYTICGYTTEEPTTSASFKVIKKERDKFAMKIAGVDENTITEATAQCLKEIAACFNHLSGALGSQIFNVGPGQLVPIGAVNVSIELMLEGFTMDQRAQALCDAVEAQSGNRAITDPLCTPAPSESVQALIDATNTALADASSTLDELFALYPPDADLDDIPDADDPCPDRTNPNPIDCDGNGIDDVCELDPATNDLNDNAILDVCEGLSACLADFDHNGAVNLGDFGVFGAAFGSSVGDANYNAAADFDNNGSVNLGDFGVFGSEFGRTDCLP